jgi:hypothetical protein
VDVCEIERRNWQQSESRIGSAGSQSRRGQLKVNLGVAIFAFGLVGLAAWVLVASSPVAKASPSDTQLQCDQCHKVELQSHGALGQGNSACHACHANPDMSSLQLANGTELALANSAPLCAECHQARYDAWVTGTHGFAGYKSGMPVDSSGGATDCTTCHNPHEPRIALSGVTKPHPAPAPAPPDPPKDLLIMFGISLVVVAGGIAITIAGRAK